MLSNRLSNKIAIVTGIGAGIGRACALMFARHSARVMGCDIDAASAQATLDTARAEGLDFDAVFPCDMTDPAQVKNFIDGAVEKYGGLDVLVNAAAFGSFKWLEEMDYERDWRRTLTGELDIVFLACQAAWKHFIARGGGSIINFASANAWGVLRRSPALAHCAGKGGVLAMTRQIALEGAPHNIRANTISPGLVITAATAPVVADPEIHDLWLGKHMLPRFGQPDDVAWAAVFLASDESSWVTAADFAIDGGTSKL